MNLLQQIERSVLADWKIFSKTSARLDNGLELSFGQKPFSPDLHLSVFLGSHLWITLPVMGQGCFAKDFATLKTFCNPSHVRNTQRALERWLVAQEFVGQLSVDAKASFVSFDALDEDMPRSMAITERLHQHLPKALKHDLLALHRCLIAGFPRETACNLGLLVVSIPASSHARLELSREDR